MASRNKRKSNSKLATSTSTAFYVYKDNVSKAGSSSFSGANGKTYEASSFGLPENAEDIEWGKMFHDLSSGTRVPGIILSADKGHSDSKSYTGGIKEVYRAYCRDGSVCIVQLALKGDDQEIGLSALKQQKGFKVVEDYPSRYERIVLSRQQNNLQIMTWNRIRNSTETNQKTTVIKNVFTGSK